ncbi:MAG: AI-2E family transporter [Cyclobacteriaceae bacterium]|nr:AI-2E family transporter [Cyclobacteriaceae bacterium]
MFLDRPFTFERVARALFIIAVIVIVYILLDFLKDVLIPFAIAMLMAYLIEPFVSFLQLKARLKSRVLSIAIALLIIVGLLTGLVALLVPMISAEVQHMGALMRDLARTIEVRRNYQEYIPEWLYLYLVEITRDTDFQGIFDREKLGETILELSQKVLPGIWNIFSGTISFFIGFVGMGIIFLYLIFILLDYRNIMQGWKEYLHPKIKVQVTTFVEDFRMAMSAYFRAQTLIASIVGVLFAIGFSIISLPLGIIFGLFVGILNLVPYLQLISFIPAALLALIYSLDTGTSYLFYLGTVLLVYTVVQLIQDGFLIPKIMGNATGLNPALILLSLSVWGKLLGIFGLLIALPATFLLKSYYIAFLKSESRLIFKPDDHKDADDYAGS